LQSPPGLFRIWRRRSPVAKRHMGEDSPASNEAAFRGNVSQRPGWACRRLRTKNNLQ